MMTWNPETGTFEEEEERADAPGPGRLGKLFQDQIAGPTFSLVPDAVPASAAESPTFAPPTEESNKPFVEPPRPNRIADWQAKVDALGAAPPPFNQDQIILSFFGFPPQNPAFMDWQKQYDALQAAKPAGDTWQDLIKNEVAHYPAQGFLSILGYNQDSGVTVPNPYADRFIDTLSQVSSALGRPEFDWWDPITEAVTEHKNVQGIPFVYGRSPSSAGLNSIMEKSGLQIPKEWYFSQEDIDRENAWIRQYQDANDSSKDWRMPAAMLAAVASAGWLAGPAIGAAGSAGGTGLTAGAAAGAGAAAEGLTLAGLAEGGLTAGLSVPGATGLSLGSTGLGLTVPAGFNAALLGVPTAGAATAATMKTLKDIYGVGKQAYGAYKFAKDPSLQGALSLGMGLANYLPDGTLSNLLPNFSANNESSLFDEQFIDPNDTYSYLEEPTYDEVTNPAPPLDPDSVSSYNPETGVVNLSDTADISRLAGMYDIPHPEVSNIGATIGQTQFVPEMSQFDYDPSYLQDPSTIEANIMANEYNPWATDDTEDKWGGLGGPLGRTGYSGGSNFGLNMNPTLESASQYTYPTAPTSSGGLAGMFKGVPLEAMAKLGAGIYGRNKNKQIANQIGSSVANAGTGMITAPEVQALMNRVDTPEQQAMRAAAAGNVTQSYTNPWEDPAMQAMRRGLSQQFRRAGNARGVNPLHSELALRSALAEQVFNSRRTSGQIANAGGQVAAQAAQIPVSMAQSAMRETVPQQLAQAPFRRSSTDNIMAALPSIAKVAEWGLPKIFDAAQNWDFSGFGFGD